MKKGSTIAATQSRNISRQQLTIGLDLGDRNSWYCVVDETGYIQAEQRVRTTAKALQEVFSAMPRSICASTGRRLTEGMQPGERTALEARRQVYPAVAVEGRERVALNVWL